MSLLKSSCSHKRKRVFCRAFGIGKSFCSAWIVFPIFFGMCLSMFCGRDEFEIIQFVICLIVVFMMDDELSAAFLSVIFWMKNKPYELMHFP